MALCLVLVVLVCFSTAATTFGFWRKICFTAAVAKLMRLKSAYKNWNRSCSWWVSFWQPAPWRLPRHARAWRLKHRLPDFLLYTCIIEIKLLFTEPEKNWNMLGNAVCRPRRNSQIFIVANKLFFNCSSQSQRINFSLPMALLLEIVPSWRERDLRLKLVQPWDIYQQNDCPKCLIRIS